MRRFERSNGLDTALYKNYLYFFYFIIMFNDTIIVVRQPSGYGARLSLAVWQHCTCYFFFTYYFVLSLKNKHAMPCHAMPCHAMPCHAMPCHAMPCHAMSCHAMLWHTIPPCLLLIRYNQMFAMRSSLQLDTFTIV